MAPAFKIARLKMDEDVFAADETKVHTLSKQAITEMLETAERLDPLSSAPPPPLSGVRTVGNLEGPSATQSGEVPVVRVPTNVVPKLWQGDDEGLEPTRLSERGFLARPALVTELIEEPPVIVCRPTPPEMIPIPVVIAPAANDVIDAALNRRVRGVALAAFLLTVLPGLAAVYYLVTMR